MEPGYPSYGGYLFSIPGFSAFQPVNHSGIPGYHPGLIQPSPVMPPEIPPPSSEFVPFPQPNTIIQQPPIQPSNEPFAEEESMDTDALLMVTDDEETQQPPPQTDFEEQFTPEVISTIPTVSISEASKPQTTESKMNITSLAQGSGATVTIPSMFPTKEVKKKAERFSLKTSIPISKIDMKCVSNPPDSLYQSALAKKSFSPAFTKELSRVEIQSNIVIKSATKETESKEVDKPVATPASNNLNTLINAAEAVNKTDSQFRVPDPPQKIEPPAEVKTPPPVVTKSIFNPMNIESNKANFIKPPDKELPSHHHASDPKNQILFFQNKNNNNQNPKMLLTLQQQNPQVLLQRSNFESKNLQAPSRLLSQSKKCKEDLMKEGSSSKVVALKRLHQENCDENDFENLITENQIYGNKIVVKEKSHGSQQEPEKNKKMVTEKLPTSSETKNVVLQPNFLYLSNVQMIVKNGAKITQTTDSNKTRPTIAISASDNKVVNETSVIVPTPEMNIVNTGNKVTKPTLPIVSKEVHVLKSYHNLLQSPSQTKPDNVVPNTDIVVKSDSMVTGKSENIVITKPDMAVTKPDIVITKPDLVFQTNQKIIVSPQIVYQLPIASIVEGDKINQPTIMNISPTFLTPKNDFAKPFEPSKANDKLYIACPYQMDSKLQPKIVITNLRPINKIDEVSSLDIYEKRKRLRRLKYLSNRETKPEVKIEPNCLTPPLPPTIKKTDKMDLRNVITPDKIKSEVYKEFASAKCKVDDTSSASESDDGDEAELKDYENIIKEYGSNIKLENEREKDDFFANFQLASRETYKEKELDLQANMLQRDKVRTAYATIGRLDVLLNTSQDEPVTQQVAVVIDEEIKEEPAISEHLRMLRKQARFLSRLKLTQVTHAFKEGYEKAWEVILKERLRRNETTENTNTAKTILPALDLDPKGQLQLMTEIKHCVYENHNLIKKMFDTVRDKQTNEESISVLAEKNFSELSRLSKMADRSVKLVSGNTRKRDLTPGFDSENIPKQVLVVNQPYENYPKLNIPKIVSLKSAQECEAVATTPATSMDEPRSSAAGVEEMFTEVPTPVPHKSVDVSCQVEESILWPGVEYFMRGYKEYDAARRREIADLHRRNTALRVEGAHITRAASRDSDKARALLAERQNLTVEENNIRLSLIRLRTAIGEITKYRA